MNKQTAREILEHCATEHAAVWAVGVEDRRVTIGSQQTRAINLVLALREVNRLSVESKVVVVGAGAAGLSACLAAAMFSDDVTLIERKELPLSVQDGSGRFIHPSINEFPTEGWDNINRLSPILPWSAGSASSFVDSLRKQFDRVRQFVTIEYCPDVDDVSFADGDLLLGDGTRISSPSAVILATGFNGDGGLHGTQSYWSNDSLHQVTEGRWLVSGAGDGAISDVLRLSLRPFSGKTLVEWLTLPGVVSKVNEIREIEERAIDSYAAHGHLAAAVDADSEYRTLDLPDLDHALTAQFRPKVQVDLNDITSCAFNLHAAACNRLILSRLLKLNKVKFVHGRLLSVRDVEGGRREVKIENREERQYNGVVVRHGPAPAGSDQIIPGVSSRVDKATRLASPVTYDSSRQAQWTEDQLPNSGLLSDPLRSDAFRSRLLQERTEPMVFDYLLARYNLRATSPAKLIPKSKKRWDLKVGSSTKKGTVRLNRSDAAYWEKHYKDLTTI